MAPSGPAVGPRPALVPSRVSVQGILPTALKILGMLTLTAGGIDLGLPLYNTRLNSMENKAVVNSFVPAVASSWKREPLAKRAAPELSPRLNPDEWRAFLDFTARLGPFLKYEGATGGAFTSLILGFQNDATAAYDAQASFQNGMAIIHIELRKHDNHWMVNDFQVKLPPAPRAGRGT